MRLLKRVLLILPVLFLVLTCSDDDDPEKFILSVTITPEEGGSVSPDGGTFEDGTAITLTATPSEGYIFKEWMGDLQSTENPVSASMDRDMNVTLVFVKSDGDNDGVFDDVDDCPNTPEGEEVDENGCSSSQIDSDEDGVSDDNDVCSDTPEGEEVDENGCADSQKDTDGDSVTDDLDACPNTPEGEQRAVCVMSRAASHRSRKMRATTRSGAATEVTPP
ncbi:MAG: InlB B-repeat-containing protein, partial [Anaerohalosphaeraceae bacterium]